MPGTGEGEVISRKDLPIFYVLDTSGSMSGEKIGMLNRAMDETVEALKEVAAKNADARLRIAVLSFDSDFKWLNPHGLEDAEDFIWQELKPSGMTYLGKALDELDGKLSKNAFMQNATGSFMPIIIFMTDGYPNDDWEAAFERIQNNRWFTKALKLGFVLSEEATDRAVLDKLTGSSEAVIQTLNLEEFKKDIVLASVSASLIQSRSRVDGDTKGENVIGDIKNKPAPAPGPDPAPDPNPDPAPAPDPDKKKEGSGGWDAGIFD
ncbi:MAG: VWA domain-containing protein [Lachnospiraceae bacterium]|nr:VWA domain-containing protein [Lachnospiraceae bacterium]